MKGSDILVHMLELHDVRHIFGVPGDTSVAVYDALSHSTSISHVMARDERSASFMADAYARVSGRPGVCEGPSGGGATYIVPGVAEAHNSSIPMVVLTTDNPLHFEAQGALTDLDQVSLFRPITKWNGIVKQPQMLPHLIRRAFRIATGGRPGPVAITLPEDVLEKDSAVRDIYADTVFRRCPAVRCRADVHDIERATQALLEASRPVMVCGGGVHLSQAWDEVTLLVELLRCPVATTVNAKGSIAESHPLSLGVIGGNGGRPYSNKVVQEADVVFFVGTKANYVDTDLWQVPTNGSCRILHLDVDPSELGNNYSTEVPLFGDVRETLAEMRAQLSANAIRSLPERADYLDSIQGKAVRWWREREARLQDKASPLLPDHVIFELKDLLPEDALLVADPGTPVPLVASSYRFERAGRYLVTPRGHGALGYAIPGVVGVQLARPEAKVVGLCGEGSFAMSVGELETIHRLNLPVTIVQFNNGTYGWIKMLQHLFHDRNYFGVDFSTDVDYVRIAQGFGLKAEVVTELRDLSGALRRAIEADCPALVDVHVRPQIADDPPVASWLRALEAHRSDDAVTSQRSYSL